MDRPIAIFGCGNRNRSDDGVGVIAARRLVAALAPEIESGAVSVYDSGTNGFEVIYKARGCGALVIIDACASGSEPGAVFEVPGEEVELPADSGINLHAFRWDHALYLARRILGDDYPDDVVAFLVEVASTELGLELSEPVAAAVDRVVERVCARVRGASQTIDARGGNLYFDRELVDLHLAGVEAVAVLDNGDGTLAICPLEAGGLILEHRNARGDRVVQAIEILRRLGIEEATLAVRWDPARGALIARLG